MWTFYMAAVCGASLPRTRFARASVKRLAEHSGMHTCLINDIYSYDKEMLEDCAMQNFVEYRRVKHCKLNVDKAISETLERCNEEMLEFRRRADALNEGRSRRLAECCAMVMTGNLLHGLEAKRYTRQALVRKAIAGRRRLG